jgi:hypothetical protein
LRYNQLSTNKPSVFTLGFLLWLVMVYIKLEHLSTADLITQLALDLRRRRRLKRISGRVVISQTYLSRKLRMTPSTFQRMESNDYMDMNLGDFIKMLKTLEDSGVNIDF